MIASPYRESAPIAQPRRPRWSQRRMLRVAFNLVAALAVATPAALFFMNPRTSARPHPLASFPPPPNVPKNVVAPLPAAEPPRGTQADDGQQRRAEAVAGLMPRPDGGWREWTPTPRAACSCQSGDPLCSCVSGDDRSFKPLPY